MESWNSALCSDRVIRDKIQEHRGGYFVTYCPADRGQWLAIVSLSYQEEIDFAEIKNAMERELKYWLQRFSVPLMVSSFDVRGSVIYFDGGSRKSHLTGYVDPKTGEIVQRWGIFKDDEFPSEQKEAGYLERAYRDVPFRLQDDVRRKVRREARIRGRVIRTIVFFYAGGALLFEIVALGVEWLGHTLAAISIATGLYKLAKAMGWLKPSERDQEEAEKERKMAHYYYHCERNPEGFNRLKIENFERDAIERTQKESEELQRRRN